ncbi:hypothetical protein PHISCL_01195 [Aspergillus sclerotialis]|uniref:Uncharacterized protein n=1 Tax=Aspergillus sclerotialis TaxID=2070753 RepID=A0A3A3A925_9EURO|nr:hypothetical protein PHISCL_01195 [Aspergillus sclerotialis]
MSPVRYVSKGTDPSASTSSSNGNMDVHNPAVSTESSIECSSMEIVPRTRMLEHHSESATTSLGDLANLVTTIKQSPRYDPVDEVRIAGKAK